ncbi:MAG: sugar ABC transporter ATP-binding protein [Defluviitaleaceae bacterium]|nr:sugar ABC transporter ATP-binding protein [Defluviitaleaceae bacterium]
MKKCLRIQSLTKDYPGVRALDDFSAEFPAGKVHAFLGKNGSGKSTLVKSISGAILPTSGALFLDDENLDLKTPSDAFAKGIATVYQELSLIPGLSVAENIFFGRMPKNKLGLINFKKANIEAKRLLDELGINISPKTPVMELSMWQRQLVEIAKAMSFQPHVLLLDEPTSSLAQSEAEKLFEVVRILRDKGVILLYISHKLQEIFDVADSVTVIRDGLLVGIKDVVDLTKEELIHMMFGDIKVETIPDDLQFTNEPVLEVKNFTSKNHFEDINFTLHKSEVLGIAGLLGTGRSELLRAIFGADSYDEGEVTVNGKKLKKASPKRGKEAGMAFTSENRKEEGLILIHSIRENLVLASLRALRNGIFMSKKKERGYVDRQVENLQIKISSPEALVSSLSGGNQQKVLVGNWINTEPQILILDEPSRGIDVNAKQQIFDIVWEQSRQGVSSIIVSSELEELLQTCHRILIMQEGRIVNEVFPKDIEVEQLYAMCVKERD